MSFKDRLFNVVLNGVLASVSGYSEGRNTTIAMQKMKRVKPPELDILSSACVQFKEMSRYHSRAIMNVWKRYVAILSAVHPNKMFRDTMSPIYEILLWSNFGCNESVRSNELIPYIWKSETKLGILPPFSICYN